MIYYDCYTLLASLFADIRFCLTGFIFGSLALVNARFHNDGAPIDLFRCITTMQNSLLALESMTSALLFHAVKFAQLSNRVFGSSNLCVAWKADDKR